MADNILSPSSILSSEQPQLGRLGREYVTGSRSPGDLPWHLNLDCSESHTLITMPWYLLAGNQAKSLREAFATLPSDVPLLSALVTVVLGYGLDSI